MSFCKQKTAYELRISDWSSDVCSSDLGAHVRLYHHLIKGDGDGTRAHNDFYDEYLAVMDLPAEYYLQTVKSVFQDHDLPLGRMTCRGDLVDPAASRKTALLTVEGEKDDITRLGQTMAAQYLCTNHPAHQPPPPQQPGR